MVLWMKKIKKKKKKKILIKIEEAIKTSPIYHHLIRINQRIQISFLLENILLL